MKQWFKDPEDTLDYELDWSTWLQDGDTITESTWSVPEGITKGSDENHSTYTLIWLSGGTLNSSYVLTNHIVTNLGREKDESVKIVLAAN